MTNPGPRPIRAAVYARNSRNKEASITDQLRECRTEAEGCRFVVVSEYRDGESASRYARRARADWALVLDAIERRDFDVLVLWEASRGDRTLTTWSKFLDLCRDRDVSIHVVNDGRTYDLNRDSDWRTLAGAGVDSAYESAKTSKRIIRGVASAAKRGRPPAGPAPYGYRRVYDPDSGALLGQEADPQTASIAVEIIKRVGAGDTLAAIIRDLNARGVPPPGRRLAGMGSQQWYRERVRMIAASQVYTGHRVHRPGRGKAKEGERAVYAAGWPALVTEADHYAALRALAGPAHTVKKARPGRQVWLLTYLATCDTCGAAIAAKDAGKHYVCRSGHVSILRESVDDHVTALVLAYLARDDVYGALAQVGEGSDAAAMAARNEAASLRTSLDQWRASAAAGETSPASLAAIEGPLTARILAADQRAERASIPLALRTILAPGADVAARWAAATVAARRLVLSELVTISIRPAGPSRRAPIEDRVIVTPRELAPGMAANSR